MADLNATSSAQNDEEGSEYKEFIVYDATKKQWISASSNLTRDDILEILKDASQAKKRRKFLQRLGLGFLLALLVAGMTAFTVILYRSLAQLQKEMKELKIDSMNNSIDEGKLGRVRDYQNIHYQNVS